MRKLRRKMRQRQQAEVEAAEEAERAQQKPETAEPARPRLSVFSELRELGVRLHRRQVDRLETCGQFPKRVPLSAGRVSWVTDEIIAWVDSRIAKRVLAPGRLGSGFTRPRPPPVAPLLASPGAS